MKNQIPLSIRFFLLFCILSILVILNFAGRVYALGKPCDGCERTAVLKSAINVEGRSMESYLAEFGTSPCFHLLDTAAVSDFIDKEIQMGIPGKLPNFKIPEYYFTVEYENDLEGQIKSRFSIKLFFYNDELVHTWTTESENPKLTFRAHINMMFKNRNAVFRKTYPLDVYVLNPFEKRPYSCEIKPLKEDLLLGDETSVTITDIRDIEGNKSREFNRIVVQALNGEIIGGASLNVDPDLKAFLVSEGNIKFKYRAPTPSEAEGISEDKIIVYNACEILDPSVLPLEYTTVKDKIAEKKIKLKKGEPFIEFDISVKGKSEDKGINYEKTGSYNYNGTLRFKLKLTDSHKFDGELHQSYEGTDCEVINLSGTSVGKTISWDADHKRKRTENTNLSISFCEGQSPSTSLSVVFDKDGKVKKVDLGGFEFSICLNGTTVITDFDGKTYTQNIPYAPDTQMPLPEIFVLDLNADFGFYNVDGNDFGDLKSGIIQGNRNITEKSDVSETVKNVTYRAVLVGNR